MLLDAILLEKKKLIEIQCPAALLEIRETISENPTSNFSACRNRFQNEIIMMPLEQTKGQSEASCFPAV